MQTYQLSATANYPQFQMDYDRIILDLMKPNGKPAKGEMFIPTETINSMTYGDLIEMLEGATPEGYKLMSYSFQHT